MGRASSRRPPPFAAFRTPLALGCAATLGLAASVAAGETPSGEPVQGLTVTLAPASRIWPAGTTMGFDATLKNVGPRPVLVDVFGDLNELYTGKRRASYLPSCWTLAWAGALAPAGPRRGRYTLAREQFIRLAPGEATTKHLTLLLSGVPPGTYRARLTYVPRAASSAFSMPDHWEDQHDLHDPIWVGMAYSNEVILEVTAPRSSAHP